MNKNFFFYISFFLIKESTTKFNKTNQTIRILSYLSKHLSTSFLSPLKYNRDNHIAESARYTLPSKIQTESAFFAEAPHHKTRGLLCPGGPHLTSHRAIGQFERNKKTFRPTCESETGANWNARVWTGGGGKKRQKRWRKKGIGS